MKTRKLGVNPHKFRTHPKNSQQKTSLNCFTLLTKGSAGILPTFLAVILPSIVGTEAIKAAAAESLSKTQLPTDAVDVYNSEVVKIAESDKFTDGSSPYKQDPVTQFQQNPSSPVPQPTSPASPAPPASSNKGIRIEIAPIGDPRTQADGRSTIRLQGQILENGQPIREDVMVTLTSSAGKFIGADQDKDQAGFQAIARNGEFIATLQSGIKPQQVKIRAAVDKFKKPSLIIQGETPRLGGDLSWTQQTDTSIFNKFGDTPLEAYTQVEFTTYLRPSLTTGVINLRIGQGGTDYWGSFQDFLNPNQIDDGTTVDLKSSLFTTGTVGEWLFTGALNSYRPINQDCEGRNRLFGGVQFCEQPYPVYGDSSTFTPTTPSIDSFYARLERTSPVPGAEPDYVMWGDFNTQEFARSSQLYTATDRLLHGFKGNYSFGSLQLTAMYSHLNDTDAFQRDTIVPDGTSGYYYLSKRLLIPGSENVYIESEEINRPGTVVQRKVMTRYTDYEIDYDRGTIKFFRPVQATDLNPFGDPLVRRVVVTYQNESGQDSNIYAGRLQYNFSQQELDNRTFAAASYLREDQGGRIFELYGADFLISLGNAGKIIGEFARSNNDLLTGQQAEGNAYRLEAIANLGNFLQGSAYYRGVEPGFANNATYSFSPGQTRYGASMLARVTNSTSLRVAYDLEENYGISPSRIVDFFDLFNPQPQARPGERVSNELETFRAGVLQKLGSADLSVEYVNRSREDRISSRFTGDAEQLVSRLKLPITQSLTFQALNEQNLSGEDPLYPNRTTLGLDWTPYPDVTFRLAHQFYGDSSLLEGNSFTTLDTIVNHKFSQDTNFSGRYSVLSAFNGLQGQGALGLNHGIRIASGLKLSLGYEYIFKNIFNATAAGSRYEQYYAIGQTASTLGLFSGSIYSVGLEYTDNPDFKASGRFEFRDGDEQGNNTVISIAAAGKISPALTALVRYQQAGEANIYLPSSAVGINQTGVRLQDLGDTANLKIGLAYRDPTNDKLNALLKYEYRQNFDTIPENILTGTTATGHVFSAEAIYAPSWRWEFYGKYALRNGVTFLSGDRYDGTANLGQLRASYKLGYRTDLAVEGRWIGQNSNNDTDYDEFGVALEAGYYLTPDLRIGLGYSFGSVDDRDFTGYRSEGGIYLNISLKLNELFGGFGLQKPVPRQQRESEVPTAAQPSTTQSRLIQRLQKTQAFATPKSKNSQQTNLIDRLKEQMTGK